jgi:hypothetical protein
MQVTCTKCSEPIALSDVIESNNGAAGAHRYDADRDRAAAAGEGGTPDPAAEDGRFVTGFERESHSSNAACSQSFTRLSASHAARCAARHGVRSHAVPVALVDKPALPRERLTRQGSPW